VLLRGNEEEREVIPEDVRQEIDRVVGECAGAVSMCWEPRPEGVFDSTQATTYVRGASDRLMSVLDAEADRRVDRKVADLRAQVEANRERMRSTPTDAATAAGMVRGYVMACDAVLALLDGEPNG
jgi:hypothetical protein